MPREDANILRVRFKERDKAGHVENDDVAGLDIEETFGLKAHQVARDEFADGAKLMCHFLVSAGELELDPAIGLFACSLCETDQSGNETLTNGGEGELLDDAHQPPKSGADHRQHFERNLRVLQAEVVKVLPGNEEDLGILDCAD